MHPTLYLFEEPTAIAEKVALQMGWTVEEAMDRMIAFDRMAVMDFCVGNDLPRSELH